MTGRNTQSGLTLVELMISLVIASIAVAASLALGFSLNTTFREQRKMSDVERAARASMDLISNIVRAASPAVSNGNLEDHVGCNDLLHGLLVVNNTNAPDELYVIYGNGSAPSATPTLGTITETSAAYDPTQATLTVFSTAGFLTGDYVVVSNVDHGFIAEVSVDSATQFTLQKVPDGGVCGYARAPPSANPLDNTPFPLAPGIPAGAIVVRAGIAHFFVCPGPSAKCTGGATELPTLYMDMDGDGNDAAMLQPVALGIEDMQIAVGIDDDGNGVIDEAGAGPNDDDWTYNVAGDTLPALPPQLNPFFINALRITLVARSITEQSAENNATDRPAAEDRAAGAPDVFRRRVVTSMIEIRNTGGP